MYICRTKVGGQTMKKIIGYFLCFLYITVVHTNIFAAPKHKLSTAKDVNGAWRITEIKGVAVHTSEKSPVLEFDCMKKSLSGWAGCNHLRGNFKFNPIKYSIRLYPLASTRMSCPDMETEANLMQSLSQVSAYLSETDAEGHKYLLMHDAEGNSLIKMIRMMPLDGKWIVATVNGQAVENTENEIFLLFDSYNKTLSGQLGCNTYSASLACDSKKTSVIRIENGLTTLRLCQDESLEKKLLQALEKVVSYKKFSDSKAILCDGGGNVLIELAR